MYSNYCKVNIALYPNDISMSITYRCMWELRRWLSED